MVDIGKSASKIASRQVTRATTRAKSRAKSQSRTKARQVGRGLKKGAVDKAKGHQAARANNAPSGSAAVDGVGLVDETDEIVELEEIAERSGYAITKIPVGFKPPRGLKLINGPEEIPEPFDFSKVPWKKLAIVIAILIAVPLLVLGGRWAVPRVTDLVRSADIDVPTIPTLPTATTDAPVVVITTWGEGACATTAADGTAKPTSCNEADLEVTSSIAYPDLDLTTDEVRVIQTLMTSLGVPVAIDGILGPQTRGAMDTFATSAGLDATANDRAKAAAVRAASLTGGSTADGPRLVQSSPELCGAGVKWVEDITQIHCLAPL
jgi:peptidoglycan hydrolase-like protein with peptidoglycan-binding domain